jgi:nicotinate dehydrogenase subunit B
MSRPAVDQPTPANKLQWPYDQRWMVAGWNLLYLRKGPDTAGDRGQVLAEGLAHCGGCHTPRNKWGAEDKARAYDGAWTEGWYAPALNRHSPAAQPWSEDELFAYLRTGLGNRHAAAAGPMANVARELAQASEQDVRAMAGYFAKLMAAAPAATRPLPPQDRQNLADRANPIGADLFAGACAHCHEAGAPMMQQGRPPLAWGTPLREDAPHDTLQIIVRGLQPPAGGAGGSGGPEMPGYAADFNDRELAAIAAYLRARFTELPPWSHLEQAAAQVRKAADE